VTDPSLDAADLYIVRGGNRARLRNRAIFLVAIAAIAIAALVNALHQAKGDTNGSVGALVIPAAVAIACLGATVMTLSQWWEDATYFRIQGARLSVSHGTPHRGRPTWYEREEPIAISAEAASGGRSVFLTQGERRVRLGNVDAHQLELWLRTHSFTLLRG